MYAIFAKSKLNGEVIAPSSKSLSHRYLLTSAITRQENKIRNILLCDDTLSTISCLEKLGCKIEIKDNDVYINSTGFLSGCHGDLNVKQSGSTLRFLLPLLLSMNQDIHIDAYPSLLTRPLSVYEDIACEQGFLFNKNINCLDIKGNLNINNFVIPGNISSQFISGLLFYLAYKNADGKIEVIEPIESKPYIDLTIMCLKEFGYKLSRKDNIIYFYASNPKSTEIIVEGDESNAAFLEAFNYIGSNVKVTDLNPNTIQGDRVYHPLFKQLAKEYSCVDLQDCPDLGPILMVIACLYHGAHFINTDRLKAKECDRALAMKNELAKLGVEVSIGNNQIDVSNNITNTDNLIFDTYDDHRIVMTTSLLACKYGGRVNDIEAVNKSFKDYFVKIRKLNAKVELYDY